MEKAIELLKEIAESKDAAYVARSQLYDSYIDDECLYCQRTATYKHGEMQYPHAIDCVIARIRRFLREYEKEN